MSNKQDWGKYHSCHTHSSYRYKEVKPHKIDWKWVNEEGRARKELYGNVRLPKNKEEHKALIDKAMEEYNSRTGR